MSTTDDVSQESMFWLKCLEKANMSFIRFTEDVIHLCLGGQLTIMRGPIPLYYEPII